MTDYKDYGYNTADPEHTAGYLRQPLLALLDKDKNGCILDIGCGNGYWVNYLISIGLNVYGVDASEEGIAIALLTNPTRFFIQDISSNKLPEGLSEIIFDTIISTEVIEHLYNPSGFITFCRQVLNGKGEVIISTPYHGYLKNLMLSLVNKWDSHFGPLWLGGHIKFWSKATLSKLLTNSGFQVVAFRGCGRLPFLWKSMIIKAKLG